MHVAMAHAAAGRHGHRRGEAVQGVLVERDPYLERRAPVPLVDDDIGARAAVAELHRLAVLAVCARLVVTGAGRGRRRGAVGGREVAAGAEREAGDGGEGGRRDSGERGEGGTVYVAATLALR